MQRGGTGDVLADRYELQFQEQRKITLQGAGPIGYYTFSLGFTFRLQPAKTLPSLMIVMVLSSTSMFKMKDSSFSVLNFPKRPLWSVLPLEVIFGIHYPLP